MDLRNIGSVFLQKCFKGTVIGYVINQSIMHLLQKECKKTRHKYEKYNVKKRRAMELRSNKSRSTISRAQGAEEQQAANYYRIIITDVSVVNVCIGKNDQSNEEVLPPQKSSSSLYHHCIIIGS